MGFSYWYLPYFELLLPSLIRLDISGFFFRNIEGYTPSSEVVEFLDAGPTPIYIGFGSIVIEDAHAITRMILDAVRECGVRAIVEEGGSKLGSSVISENHPDVIFIGDCPHGL